MQESLNLSKTLRRWAGKQSRDSGLQSGWITTGTADTVTGWHDAARQVAACSSNMASEPWFEIQTEHRRMHAKQLEM